MAKGGKSTATPRLRFPEFRNARAWEKSKLGSIATILKGKGVAKSDVVVGGAHPCIRYGELYTRYGEVIDTVASHTNTPLSDLFLSRRHDVIIPASGETKLEIAKASCVLHDGVALGSDLNVLRSADNGVFLSYLLNGSKRNEIARVAQGDSVVHLYPSQLQEIVVSTPDLAEQAKIADCLMSGDAVIAGQGRKVAALLAHKLGLMQLLFPRDGENLPRLRFPDFRHDPAWEETKLSQLGELVSGLTYSPSDVREEGLLVLRSSNIQNGGILLDDRVYVTPDIKGANLSAPSDILICVRNGSKSLIGKSAMIPEGMPLCTHGAFMTVFRAPAPHFAFQLMQSKAFRRQVAADLGATINSINGGQFLKYRFVVPRAAEQKRIADFLSALDAQIAVEAGKLVALRIHKSGLMQELFPSPEHD